MRTPDGTDGDQTSSAAGNALPMGDASLSSARKVTVPHSATTSTSRGPTRNDVVFRLAAATFCTWVVLVVATSPVSHQRPGWWPWFIGVGVVLACAMLAGAFMTLNAYLRERY